MIDYDKLFWSRVDKNGPGGCWIWLWSRRKEGHGYFTIGKNRYWAHRVAYELLVGPIPPGLQIDHLCRVPWCVNPSHLEPVTVDVNVMRGESQAAKNARKTHCVHGHPFDETNTYRPPGAMGWRVCRTCTLARRKAS